MFHVTILILYRLTQYKNYCIFTTLKSFFTYNNIFNIYLPCVGVASILLYVQ